MTRTCWPPTTSCRWSPPSSAGFEDIVEAIDAITAELTTEDLVEMNKRFDIDKEDAAVIAKDFLDGAGLL